MPPIIDSPQIHKIQHRWKKGKSRAVPIRENLCLSVAEILVPPAIAALSAEAGSHCFNLECGAVLNESAA